MCFVAGCLSGGVGSSIFTVEWLRDYVFDRNIIQVLTACPSPHSCTYYLSLVFAVIDNSARTKTEYCQRWYILWSIMICFGERFDVFPVGNCRFELTP